MFSFMTSSHDMVDLHVVGRGHHEKDWSIYNLTSNCDRQLWLMRPVLHMFETFNWMDQDH